MGGRARYGPGAADEGCGAAAPGTALAVLVAAGITAAGVATKVAMVRAARAEATPDAGSDPAAERATEPVDGAQAAATSGLDAVRAARLVPTAGGSAETYRQGAARALVSSAAAVEAVGWSARDGRLLARGAAISAQAASSVAARVAPGRTQAIAGLAQQATAASVGAATSAGRADQHRAAAEAAGDQVVRLEAVLAQSTSPQEALSAARQLAAETHAVGDHAIRAAGEVDAAHRAALTADKLARHAAAVQGATAAPAPLVDVAAIVGSPFAARWQGLVGQVNALAASSGAAAGGAGIQQIGTAAYQVSFPDGSLMRVVEDIGLRGAPVVEASTAGMTVRVASPSEPAAYAALSELVRQFEGGSAAAMAGRGAGDSEAAWVAKSAGLDRRLYFLSSGQPHRLPNVAGLPGGREVPVLAWSDTAGYVLASALDSVPLWRVNTTRGDEFHLEQQARLGILSRRGVAELNVHNPRSELDPSRAPLRVDFYDAYDYIIYSMKSTQLASVGLATARRYIVEAATKYAPGTPIQAGKNTPPNLLGQPLLGQVVLLVPLQSAPVPVPVAQFAESLQVWIVDPQGRRYA